MHHSRSLRLPNHWIECPAMAEMLVGGRFLAFKTPLDSRYDQKIQPNSKYFKPAHVVSRFQRLKQTNESNLKAVIDLTNSQRYYNPIEFTSSNQISHYKIACAGHDQCPNNEQVQIFFRYCLAILNGNSRAVIGVHCTHGFNRTGFMICAFLVEHMDFSLDKAIGLFRKARPPGIYKQDYIDALLERYGDNDCEIEPVMLPSWRPGPNKDDYAGDYLSHPLIQSMQRAGVGQNDKRKPQNNSTVTQQKELGSSVIGSPVEAVYACPILEKVRQYTCAGAYRGFPGYQAVSMDMENISLLKENDYRVSWKADGTRYLCLINGKDRIYFIDRSNKVFRVPNISFPLRGQPDQNLKDTLVDGELIFDRVDNIEIPRYLIFDVVTFQDEPVGTTCNFDDRQNCIYRELIEPRNEAISAGLIDKSKESFSVRRKDFWNICTVRKILDGQFSRQISHDVDGLVFQPLDLPYCIGTCNKILKWKPNAQNSIDFRLKIIRQKKLGEPERYVGQLFTLGLKEPFSTIDDVSSDLLQHDGSIIECTYTSFGWTFMRVRSDKNVPNSIKTALSICRSIEKPVTKQLLFSYIAECLGTDALSE